MNRTQRLLTEEAPPDTRAIPCSRDPAYASDQTSDLACRRKVGAFDITIRK
jgi:hypothetical protein